ncbi:MAG: hypothetical protein HGB05_01680 [Chloroflexi bacterium]|nr:hypothetical protein [Chloroflexota bacterium]
MAVLLTIAACSPNSARLAQSTLTPSGRPTTQSSPYPYTTPLPPPVVTDLDGLYAKIDPKPGTPVPCKRCPDYAPAGGAWQLGFDKSTYRVLHVPTGWRSVGSYTVSGNQLTLFNDPVCHNKVGTYTWIVKNGELTFQEIDDQCAIQLRAVNLTRQPWSLCQPPNTEVAVTDHWLKPAGCPNTAVP